MELYAKTLHLVLPGSPEMANCGSKILKPDSATSGLAYGAKTLVFDDSSALPILFLYFFILFLYFSILSILVEHPGETPYV